MSMKDDSSFLFLTQRGQGMRIRMAVWLKIYRMYNFVYKRLIYSKAYGRTY